MKNVLIALWTLGVFCVGYASGENSAVRDNLKNDVCLYQKKETNTAEQEKTAEKIKIIYRDLKTNDKDCDFVLNFNISECLHN